MRAAAIAAAVALGLAVLVLAGTASAQQTVTITTFAQLREYAFRTATRLLGVEQRVAALEQRVAALEQRVAALEARDQAWSDTVLLQACLWNGIVQRQPDVVRQLAGIGYWRIPAGYTCQSTAPAELPPLPLRPR